MFVISVYQRIFDPDMSADDYLFSDEDIKIEKGYYAETCAFLKRIVSKGIHVWKFSIFTNEQYNTTKTIGI